MATMEELEIHAFVDLYELRELWSDCWADWYISGPCPGAQTMFVKENVLKGVFTSEKLIKSALSRRARAVRGVLNEGDTYDSQRVFGRHNVYSRKGSEEWRLRVYKRRVSTSELEEENGLVYWNRPTVRSFRDDGDDGNIPTTWVMKDLGSESARRIRLDRMIRSKI